MRKVLLVCPDCGISYEGWRELVSHSYYRNICLENNYIYQQLGDTYNFYHICTEHDCGFVTFGYKIIDFIVEIEDDEIVKLGKYWKDHLDDLKKFLKISENVEEEG